MAFITRKKAFFNKLFLTVLIGLTVLPTTLSLIVDENFLPTEKSFDLCLVNNKLACALRAARRVSKTSQRTGRNTITLRNSIVNNTTIARPVSRGKIDGNFSI